MWIFYGVVFSLVILRITHREQERPYKVWIPVPCLMVLISIFLVITPMMIQEQAVTALMAITRSSDLLLPGQESVSVKDFRQNQREDDSLDLVLVKMFTHKIQFKNKLFDKIINESNFDNNA